MITATIVVFIAIFGGMAVLGLMIWLMSRRNGGDSSSNHFVGGMSSTSQHGSHHSEMNETEETDFVDNSYYADGNEESKASASAGGNIVFGQNAYESPTNTEVYQSASSQTEYSAPADYSYSDSSSSSYDSGGSSSDSSSSDSGSSSSSSD